MTERSLIFDDAHIAQLRRRRCDIQDCRRPAINDGDGVHIVRCALHEIACYNTEDLRAWGEENAADMVDIARAELNWKPLAS